MRPGLWFARIMLALYERTPREHVCTLTPRCSEIIRTQGIIRAAHRAARLNCGCRNSPNWTNSH
jgi:hypothetical protein